MTDAAALLFILVLALCGPACSYVLATLVIRYAQRKFDDR